MKRDPVTSLMPPQIVALARFSQAALIMLNARMFGATALICSAAAFAYVLYAPDDIRLAGACAFALLVLWPCLRLETQRRESQPQGEQNE